MIIGPYSMYKCTPDLLKVFFNISENTAFLIGTCRRKMLDVKFDISI